MTGKKRESPSKTWVIFKERMAVLKEKGLTQSEIADRLGVSKANLHVKLNKSQTLESDFWEKFKEIYG